MDPTSLLVAGGMFVITEMSRKAGDDAVEAMWAAIKNAWKLKFGREPEPSEIDIAEVESLATGDSEIAAHLDAFWHNTAVLRRAHRAEAQLKGARVLWVDDHPEWNRLERQFLQAFQLHIVTVETTRSAVACLRGEPFDLVISDISRGGNVREGIDALPELAKARAVPVVFYVGELENEVQPSGAFAITNRPGDLLHFCMDVLERRC